MVILKLLYVLRLAFAVIGVHVIMFFVFEWYKKKRK